MTNQKDISDAAGESCPAKPFTHLKTVLANVPYAAMVVLGCIIFLVGPITPFGRWLSAGLYLVYGVGGAFWVMFFVCPYCHFYGTRLCPCGYGIIATRLRRKKDGDQFARQFKRHIPVIVPLWIIPAAAAVVFMFWEFSWPMLGLGLAFAVNSFLILPLVSARGSCKKCPQKDTCPWMRRRSQSCKTL